MFAHEDLDFKPISNWAEKVNLDSLRYRQKFKLIGKTGWEVHLFKDVLGFFIWRNGQSKMMLLY